jgi:hypothetical protein
VCFSRKGYTGFISLLSLSFVLTTSAKHLPVPERCVIHFLATSTSVRTGAGHNEDVYLAELAWRRSPDSGSTTLARLIDEYPAYRAPIAQNILTGSAKAVFRVLRDESCDRPLLSMPLRSAPGDPEAVLPERLGYVVPPPFTVDISDTLPCYRLVRR